MAEILSYLADQEDYEPDRSHTVERTHVRDQHHPDQFAENAAIG